LFNFVNVYTADIVHTRTTRASLLWWRNVRSASSVCNGNQGIALNEIANLTGDRQDVQQLSFTYYY